ncbi:MAG: sulfurtransferase-like selenium metabolism protein YedF [Dissulfuribacterales bacterium]
MKKLDCRGLACPKPVLETKAFIEANQSEIFEILVDNPVSSQNVTRFLASQHWTSTVREENGIFVITAAPSTCELAFSTEKSSSDQRILVFIPTDRLGSGDDELGAKLMKSFVATLKEMGKELWRIVLVNGGVRLALPEAACFEDLRALEAVGVSILVCGTCLQHFGLVEQKQVGETTNMLDIVTSLQIASKVIRI